MVVELGPARMYVNFLLADTHARHALSRILGTGGILILELKRR
jgi:hypothetical protein